MAEEPEEFIDEDPMTPSEINEHLREQFKRKEIRQFLYILRKADLIVFRA